jgi:L-lactate dehydrogenase complex protein LldE
MRIGLLIPCYIDQLYPDVGIATLEILERLGLEVDFPSAQTCCGQPMSNTGCTDAARRLAERVVDIFEPFTHVVCPSGSCTAMIRLHYGDLLPDGPRLTQLQTKTYELCEFLHDVMQVKSWPFARFPVRVGLHVSCHGLRELRLGRSSETMAPRPDKVRDVLKLVDGIEMVSLERPDECCGFGGTFAVSEEAVSAVMGRDRIADHRAAGAEVLTAADMSCLMHLDGLIRRDHLPLPVMHVAQILAGRPIPVSKKSET